MLLLIDTFSINKGRGYENPSWEIIVTERCSTGGCPLKEACEHCYLNQSVVSVAISYIISVYCEDYAGYFTVILAFLAFHFCSLYFIYLVSCMIFDAPSESVNRCCSIPGKIFNFVPGNGARNVGDGSHPWIAAGAEPDTHQFMS